MTRKKILALLGCLLTVGMSIPPTTAHLTGPSTTSEALTGDSYRFAGDTPTTHSGVSGTYSGSADASTILCDMEVLGDGSAPSPQDESDVDGTPGGVVPDGTFDDGGFGGACHTNNQYGSAYDTSGCQGTAYAKDAVSGGSVWIGAACDWKTTVSPPGFTTCVVNQLISNPTVPGFAICVADLVAGGTGGGTFLACGNDGVADSINYDTGGNGALFLDGAAIDGCDPYTDSSAAVFVFNQVDECTVSVIPAVGGWIDNPDGGQNGGFSESGTDNQDHIVISSRMDAPGSRILETLRGISRGPNSGGAEMEVLP